MRRIVTNIARKATLSLRPVEGVGTCAATCIITATANADITAFQIDPPGEGVTHRNVQILIVP
eukprot:1951797-Pleurochrysis_carterae.AAC.1